MNRKLPTKIWIDRETVLRPHECSHIAYKNVFEPGAKYISADKIADQITWYLFMAFAAGALWMFFILLFAGVV